MSTNALLKIIIRLLLVKIKADTLTSPRNINDMSPEALAAVEDARAAIKEGETV